MTKERIQRYFHQRPLPLSFCHRLLLSYNIIRYPNWMLNGTGIKIFSGECIHAEVYHHLTLLLGTSHPELAEIIARR